MFPSVLPGLMLHGVPSIALGTGVPHWQSGPVRESIGYILLRMDCLLEDTFDLGAL
jgi:hypothetical protein